MKKNILTITLLLGMACSGMAQSRVYTLAEWQNVDANKELALNVSEYKLDFNHPLPYADMQRSWTVKAELKCGTLGTEQVFVCKEGKASHLIGRNSLNGRTRIFPWLTSTDPHDCISKGIYLYVCLKCCTFAPYFIKV